MSMRRSFPRGSDEKPLVYLIFTQRLVRRGRSFECLERALKAGVGVVQIREKSLDDRELLDHGRRVRELTARFGVPLIVNDRADIAVAIGADGVHVGQGDMSPVEARSIVGENAWIGLSTHRLPEVAAADPAIVDYLGFGPIFSTTTKTDAEPTTGVDGLLSVIGRRAEMPIFPIGGIDDVGARAVGRIGVRNVAVSSFILAADDPAEAVRLVIDALRG